MVDDIGSGLSSMAVFYHFRSINIVQLSNWNSCSDSDTGMGYRYGIQVSDTVGYPISLLMVCLSRDHRDHALRHPEA